MRGRLGVVAVLALGVVVGWNGAGAYSGQPPFGGQRATPSPRGSALIALPLDGGPTRQLVLVDPVRRVVAVYQIDANDGSVVLKGVRDVQWDFQLRDYNGTRPSPDEIRALIRQPQP